MSSVTIPTESTAVVQYKERPPSCLDTVWCLDIFPLEDRQYWTEEEVNHWHIQSNERRVSSKYHKWGLLTVIAGGSG